MFSERDYLVLLCSERPRLWKPSRLSTVQATAPSLPNQNRNLGVSQTKRSKAPIYDLPGNNSSNPTSNSSWVTPTWRLLPKSAHPDEVVGPTTMRPRLSKMVALTAKNLETSPLPKCFRAKNDTVFISSDGFTPISVFWNYFWSFKATICARFFVDPKSTTLPQHLKAVDLNPISTRARRQCLASCSVTVVHCSLSHGAGDESHDASPETKVMEKSTAPNSTGRTLGKTKGYCGKVDMHASVDVHDWKHMNEQV